MRLTLFCFKTMIALFLAVILLHTKSYCQSYGLGFQSHETVQDKRTALALNLDKISTADNLDISFDLSFIPNQQTYFGYIFRLVSDGHQNIDLIYDNQLNTRHFKIITGERLSNISFNIDSASLLKNWYKFRLILDYKHNRLVVISDGKSYTESGVHLQRSRSYKLLFGANTYQKYQTTDLPPFKLRDVKVSQDSKPLFDWPLNESDGNIAGELINKNNGLVTNALWIKGRHRNWSAEKEFSVTGDATIAFDPKKEIVYIITRDSLITWSFNKKPQLQYTAYRSGRESLIPGDLSLFHKNKLYYLFIDQMATGVFDLKDNKWSRGFKNSETNTGHLNKFFSKTDSAIYTIGGYGQLVYKDTVKRYSLADNTWQVIKTQGDTFTPRYLAGLGTNAAGDTAYIIGGYGSASGQQIVNPHNLSDMMRFTVKDRRFKKLFNIELGKEDFVFANSLIINEKEKSYYGLIFPQHKFNSTLQLIKGTLTGPEYRIVGDTIPYQFQDTRSFADLCYLPGSNRFLAVTQYKENEHTNIKIYSLLSPPEPLVTTTINTAHINYWIWLAVVCLILLLITVYMFTVRHKHIKAQPFSQPHPLRENGLSPLPEPEFINGENNHDKNRNAIYLFGDLQLFTPDGNEITKYFTPLLKELFLVILLYSVKQHRGVSSEKLNEILWFDKSEKSARNNRSVNIAKLKSLLDKMGHCHLSKDTGVWKIEIDYSKIMVDYHNYLEIVSDKNKLNKQKIIQLTHITGRGNFLSDIEYEWLDVYKSEVSNEIIDSYVQYANSIPVTDDPEFLIKLANDVSYFDPVNEDAMVLKCKALSSSGKHSLAKNTFANFIKEYRVIYGEDFKKDFHAILE